MSDDDKRPVPSNRQTVVAKVLMVFHVLFLFTILLVFNRARRGIESDGTLIALIGITTMVVQFTWGLAVGLYVGPGARRRPLLWGSLLTIFLPMVIVRWATIIAWFVVNPIVAVAVLLLFIVILACETWAGVLQGLKLHVQMRRDV